MTDPSSGTDLPRAATRGLAPNPVLLEVRRGARVESVHRGTWVLADADGAVLEGAGAYDEPTCARSTLKCFQALPMLESGAADAFALSPAELAVCVSSHNGERQHMDHVEALLSRAELGVDALQCGSQPPRDPRMRKHYALTGDEPTALDNNCSGKHAGFLLQARHLGVDPAGYLDLDGEVQRRVHGVLVDLTGLPEAELQPAIDGCSAPTFFLPLARLASAYARVGTPDALPPERAAACRRLHAAVAENPQLIAGSYKRICTDLAAAGGGVLFPKIGGEAVYTVAHKPTGRALAVKVDDGSVRGLHAVLVALLARFDFLDAVEIGALERWSAGVDRNWAGRAVGRLEVTL